MFDLDGKMSISCPDIFREINIGTLGIGFPDDGYDVFYPSLNPDIPMSTNNYYNLMDVFFVSKVNVQTCQVASGGKASENSVYRTLNLPVRGRGIIEPVGKDHILLYFQFDKEIQILNKNDFSIHKVLTLSPAEFRRVVPATDNSLQEKTRLAQLNPAYVRMKVTSDGKYLVTQYKSGLDDFSETQEFLNGESRKASRWIEVYDLETSEKLYEGTGNIPNSALLVQADDLESVFFGANDLDGDEGTYLISASYGR
jgi:hypothetical protein